MASPSSDAFLQAIACMHKADKVQPCLNGGTPDDVANVCVFLGSELSSYVTGQVIKVCGGMNT